MTLINGVNHPSKAQYVLLRRSDIERRSPAVRFLVNSPGDVLERGHAMEVLELGRRAASSDTQETLLTTTALSIT